MGEDTLQFLILVIILSLAWPAYLYRIREGVFKITGETETALMFTTSVGTFRLNKTEKLIQFKEKNKSWKSFPFANVEGIKYRQNETPAHFLELLTGFDLIDLFPNYRDKYICCSISVQLSENKEVPLFCAMQYEEREFFVEGFLVHITRGILRRLGLFHEVSWYSDRVFDQIRTHFQSVGLPSKRL